MTPTSDRHVDTRTVISRVTVVAASVLHAVVLVPFTLAAGLVAPLWAIIALGIVWLVAAAILWRLARRQPFATPLIPVLNGAVVWATITAGETWLGWTP